MLMTEIDMEIENVFFSLFRFKPIWLKVLWPFDSVRLHAKLIICTLENRTPKLLTWPR